MPPITQFKWFVFQLKHCSSLFTVTFNPNQVTFQKFSSHAHYGIPPKHLIDRQPKMITYDFVHEIAGSIYRFSLSYRCSCMCDFHSSVLAESARCECADFRRMLCGLPAGSNYSLQTGGDVTKQAETICLCWFSDIYCPAIQCHPKFSGHRSTIAMNLHATSFTHKLIIRLLSILFCLSVPICLQMRFLHSLLSFAFHLCWFIKERTHDPSSQFVNCQWYFLYMIERTVHQTVWYASIHVWKTCT